MRVWRTDRRPWAQTLGVRRAVHEADHIRRAASATVAYDRRKMSHHRHLRGELYLVVVPIFLILIACGTRATDAPTERTSRDPLSGTVEIPSTAVDGFSRTAVQSLVTGEFTLAAARAFGEPGFHQVYTARHSFPPDLGQSAEMRVVLSIRDAGRSAITCSIEHPLSGCATVDWSDEPSRPKVPPGGVFENSVTLQLASGSRTFFLSESGSLNDAPDRYDPG